MNKNDCSMTDLIQLLARPSAVLIQRCGGSPLVALVGALADVKSVDHLLTAG